MFKKILSTQDGSSFSSVVYDSGRGNVYALSDSGDTYIVSSIPLSYGKYGPTSIFSSVYDGHGDRTGVASFSMVYDLFDAVISANQDGSYVSFPAGDVYGANIKEVVYGRYISNVLNAGDGLGYWKTFSWKQTTPGNSFVDIYVKVADSEEALASSDWMHRYRGEESYLYGDRLIIDLDRFNLKGRFMQFMVEMSTSSRVDRPYVAEMEISYVGAHSVYFFSDAIRIESGTPGHALLTASMSIPRKTDIVFGVGPGGSGDWKDYVPIDLDRIVSIPPSFGKRFKVGARLSSHDSLLSPVIHEFALSFEAPTNNEVNL
jgi:hypothetical protein